MRESGDQWVEANMSLSMALSRYAEEKGRRTGAPERKTQKKFEQYGSLRRVGARKRKGNNWLMDNVYIETRAGFGTPSSTLLFFFPLYDRSFLGTQKVKGDDQKKSNPF